MLDVNYLFPFRKEQNSCPHFTGEKLTLQEDQVFAQGHRVDYGVQVPVRAYAFNRAAAALIVPNDTTLE